MYLHIKDYFILVKFTTFISAELREPEAEFAQIKMLFHNCDETLESVIALTKPVWVPIWLAKENYMWNFEIFHVNFKTV